MKMANRITHIRKPNAASEVEHITHVKGVDANNRQFQKAVQEVIALIRANNRFFVRVGNNEINVTFQRSSSGLEYIKTEPDRTTRDNLLSLPQF